MPKQNKSNFGILKNINLLLAKFGFGRIANSLLVKFGFKKLGKAGDEARKAAKFIAGLAAAFIAIYLIESSIPLVAVEAFVAAVVMETLKLLGFEASIIIQEPVVLMVGEKAIAISYLCTGLLEIAVIVAAIGASFGVNIYKRIIGMALAVIATMLFNFFRIVSTILIIFSFELQIAELAHEFLFRIFLFVVIVGIYAVWFKWAIKK